jgi:hypothetical protein
MAPLVGIAPHFGAVLAAHVTFQLMNLRCLWSPHDVEGNGLVRVAADAADLKIGVTALSASPKVGDGCAGP